MVKHAASPPTHISDLTPRSATATGDREWRYWNIATSEQGSPTSAKGQGTVSLSLLSWPEGFRRAIGSPGELEWHPQHEEVFVLRGAITWEGGYTLTAPAYFNHPPFWVHSTVVETSGAVELLDHVTQYPVTGFEPKAADWHGNGYFASGLPSRCKRGVDGLDLETIPWVAVTGARGAGTGYEARHIWDDPEDGWSSWMMRVPAGWQGAGSVEAIPGGDEIFVLKGDLTLDRGSGPFTLRERGHFCDPERFVHGGPSESSANGCLALRWTRAGPLLNLPGATVRLD